jgi:5,10-methylene-tetrahydrofolate dehydrogenase/methenyl tetrahydrofolate cyclohydrolase
MSVDLAREIYNELKRYVNSVDKDEAAETLVAVLIDNDIDADEIKATFKSETEVKRALTSYLKDHPEDDEEEDEEDFEYDDEEDDNY